MSEVLNPMFFTRKGGDFGMYLKIADKTYTEMFENPGMGPAKNKGYSADVVEIYIGNKPGRVVIVFLPVLARLISLGSLSTCLLFPAI